MSNFKDVNFVEQPSIERFYKGNKDVLNKMLKESRQDILFDYPIKFLPLADNIRESINMRVALIDWLKQVNIFRKSKPGVLALTIDILDRYLYSLSCQGSEIEVNAMNYQCIGASSYYMASKLEEVSPISAIDISKFTSECCSRSDIMDMEILIAFQLNFNVKYLTPIDFIYFLIDFVDLTKTTKEFIRNYAIDNYLYVINNCYIKRFSSHITAISFIILGFHGLEDFTENELKANVKRFLDLIPSDMQVQLRSCYEYLSGIIVTRIHSGLFDVYNSEEIVNDH